MPAGHSRGNRPPRGRGTLRRADSGSRVGIASTPWRPTPMPAISPAAPRHSTSYNIFILVLTIYSLALMVIMLLPVNQAALTLATTFDTTICVVFLFDFFLNLLRAP